MIEMVGQYASTGKLIGFASRVHAACEATWGTARADRVMTAMSEVAKRGEVVLKYYGPEEFDGERVTGVLVLEGTTSPESQYIRLWDDETLAIADWWEDAR